MDSMMNCKEAAALWDISERWVSILCKEGKIPGAVKQGHRWVLPRNTEKPADGRVKSGAYRKISRSTRLPFPIGITDFRKICTEYYYVDKTLLIRDFLDQRPKVSLFTRPRRFGKTLNLDMLRVFFEKTDEDTSVFFRDKKIWACGDSYRRHQGQYPVIFLSFKDVRFDTWEQAMRKLRLLLQSEYSRHRQVLSGNACADYEKVYFHNVVKGTCSDEELVFGLSALSQMLDEYYGTAPVIFIDEYDTPVVHGCLHGYGEEVSAFLQRLFSCGFKDNSHLSYGFLAGVFPLTENGLFSETDNLKIHSVFHYPYSRYFGFTLDEVQEMAIYAGAPDACSEILEWYDGYCMGDVRVLNPWSVTGYFGNECQPQAFWASSGDGKLIKRLFEELSPVLLERVNTLLQGKTVLAQVRPGVDFSENPKDWSSVYGLLAASGYLTVRKSAPQFSGDYMCELAVPNREIKALYRKELLSCLTGNQIIPAIQTGFVEEALFLQDRENLQRSLVDFLCQSIRMQEEWKTFYFQGLAAALTALTDGYYEVYAEEDREKGRFDLRLFSCRKTLPNILAAMRTGKYLSTAQLEALAQDGLRQLGNVKPDGPQAGTVRYGIAFCGKTVKVRTDRV